MFTPSPQKLAATLAEVKRIAVLGAKDTPGHPVDMVGRYLIAAGFEVVPVHPKRKSVWGLPTYTSLAEIPGSIDLVNLFRAAQYCPQHARETLALPVLPRIFWMQEGIFSTEAKDILAGQPIVVVEDVCLKIFHRDHLAQASHG